MQQNEPQTREAPSAILNQLAIALVEIDVEGCVTSANERFCSLVERPREAMLLRKMPLREVVHPADMAALNQTLARVFGAGTTVVRELRLVTPDQRPRWVEIASAPPGNTTDMTDTTDAARSAMLVLTDISKRKLAEARASETERRFRDLADAAPVFIWTSGRGRERRHTWVSRRWAEFCGRPLESELGRGWTHGVHPDDLDACLASYADAFDRCQSFTSEYRLRRHDGEYRWMLDTGAPIHDEHGECVGYIGSSIDITERKAAERDREALLAAECSARSEAERANQLKEEFLSILSHELRTPLNAVLGWVHLLRTPVTSGPQLERGLDVIERNARLQSRMVDDLLDMGGVMAGKMRLELRPVHLDRVIEGVVESLEPSFLDKGVLLRKEISGDGLVDGDAHRLHQIVWNLLSNALKFTLAGGEVVVTLRDSGDAVEIEVTDNGPGIEPDFLPFVFERFRQGDPTTRRSHGGLGIGLALVKSLTELHGGHVSVASGAGTPGSTFTVTLPVSTASEDRMPPTRHASGDGTRLEGVLALDLRRSAL